MKPDGHGVRREFLAHPLEARYERWCHCGRYLRRRRAEEARRVLMENGVVAAVAMNA